jgi:hypothetical protein
VKKSKPEPIRKTTKRASDGDKVPPRKRQKKQETPVSEDEDSELTSIEDTPEDSEDSYVSDAPKAKKQKATPKDLPKPAPKQPQKKKVDSRHVDEKERKGAPKGSTKVSESNLEKKLGSKIDPDDSDSDLSEIESPDFDQNNGGKAAEADGSDSDMSVVLDEPPRRKQNSKSTSHDQLATSTTKSSKPSKTPKASVDLSPDEAEIKTLQTQLTKCGIRKIWGVVLKPYGMDSKAKIKHLKGMLKDAGMEGRFSEAKAREIKEGRELMADLEAVKEGEAIWGMGRESRSKKAREKKTIDDSDQHEDDGEMETRSRSVSEKPQPRIARAKLDLAFLGDEESDSDD